jgi:hypothetical protein
MNSGGGRRGGSSGGRSGHQREVHEEIGRGRGSGRGRGQGRGRGGGSRGHPTDQIPIPEDPEAEDPVIPVAPVVQPEQVVLKNEAIGIEFIRLVFFCR